MITEEKNRGSIIGRRLTAAALALILALAALPCALADHYALRDRNLGPNRMLRGNVKALAVFVSTPKNKWTKKRKDAVMKDMQGALNTIVKASKKYKVPLKMSFAYFETSLDYEYSSGNDWYREILKNYFYKENMTELQAHYEKTEGVDDTPFLFLFYRSGRSYAHPSGTDYPHWQDEYAEISAKDSRYRKAVIMHELLHLYGAADMYDPKVVAKASKKYFPSSVMYTTAKTGIDDLTAYLIGWRDDLSSKAKKFLEATKNVDQ